MGTIFIKESLKRGSKKAKEASEMSWEFIEVVL